MTHEHRDHLTPGNENRLLTLAVILSLTGHLLLFAFSHILTTSGYKPHQIPRSIEVDLVQTELPPTAETNKGTASALPEQPPAPTPETAPARVPDPPAPAPPAPEPVPPKSAPTPKPARELPEVPTKTATAPKAVKTEQKVVTPEELLKSAIDKIAKEASRPEPLADRLSRLKKEVASQKPPETAGSPAGSGTGTPSGGQITVQERYYRTIEVIIRKNWAFPAHLAGGNAGLKTQLIFTVMPDGSVREVWISQRSGNDNFDRSALSAVQKSTPLPPFPAGINDTKMPFVIDFDISELL